MCIKVTRRGCCFSGICGKETLRWNRRNNVFFRYMRFYRHLSFRMCSNVMIIKKKEMRVDVPILHVGVCTNRTRITRKVIYRSARLSISGNLLMRLQVVCQTGFDAPREKMRVTLVRKGNSTFGFKIPITTSKILIVQFTSLNLHLPLLQHIFLDADLPSNPYRKVPWA